MMAAPPAIATSPSLPAAFSIMEASGPDSPLSGFSFAELGPDVSSSTNISLSDAKVISAIKNIP